MPLQCLTLERCLQVQAAFGGLGAHPDAQLQGQRQAGSSPPVAVFTQQAGTTGIATVCDIVRFSRFSAITLAHACRAGDAAAFPR